MTEQVPIASVKPNPDNPRVIRDERFAKLVQSIQEFPEMLELRPIVVNSDRVVLGGNMRLRACQKAGLTTVPIIIADNLTPQQQQEFAIKDNTAFGEWDWDVLANTWEITKLNDWGVAEVAQFKPATTEERELDLSHFSDSADTYLNNTIRQIVLHYDKDTHADVLERLRAVAKIANIVDDNSATLLALLEFWEHNQ